ncbi:DUF3795 domain-containing protein [Methanolobus sp. ZRKC2]|uniref:DUF3795 domain-containing protein n=1 Tax=Methanolobus sp. ZRKC2 TaxID=3125783 RepID=UPI00324C2F3C
MESSNDISLLAPCGINCSVCMVYLRERNKCPGCRGPDDNKPISRTGCKIKNCTTFCKGDAEFCFECEDFPCKRLKGLDKTYRTKYSMSIIDNLENIREFGIVEFLENEITRWTCAKCGGTVCVHKGYCYSCGERKLND